MGEPTKCEGCGSTNIIPDPEHGQRYCVNCGLYVEEAVYEYYDPYPSYDTDGESVLLSVTDPSQVNKGLGALLPQEIFEIFPTIFTTLRRGFGRDTEERSFHAALPSLRLAWRITHLSNNLIKRSAQLYRLCIKRHLVRGMKREALAAATAYIAATEAGYKRDIVWVSEVMQVSVDEIVSCEIMIRDKIGYSADVPYVLEYIKDCATALHITQEVLKRMLDIGANVIDKKLEQGRHPASVAGAIVYFVCTDAGTKKSRKQIAKALNVISEKSIVRAGEFLAAVNAFVLQPETTTQEKSPKTATLDSI